ncbi:hypothetical protein AERO9A_300059 [Aeromonas salmonicida]|nr:hypothetical protein AERO9A_300059 [Aeromonas salmonicida]
MYATHCLTLLMSTCLYQQACTVPGIYNLVSIQHVCSILVGVYTAYVRNVYTACIYYLYRTFKADI